MHKTPSFLTMFRTISIGLLFALLPPWIVFAEGEESEASALSVLQWYQPTFWRTVDGMPVEECWTFSGDEIALVRPRGGRGSLISPSLPANFELSFQWKIEAGGNNGLKYRVRWFEDRWLGIEYQMIDEPIPLTELHVGSTASIYDLFAPVLNKPLHPAGQWNRARIVASGSKIEHYLNDALVASANTSSLAWQSAIARSKFFGFEEFGQPRPGDSIMLTDHGGTAAYRDFQFREFPISAKIESQTPRSPQLANGLRNGWASQSSIVLWTRTTARQSMVENGIDFLDMAPEDVKLLGQSRDSKMLNQIQLPEGASLDQISGACPGTEGQVRLTYFPEKTRSLAITTEWVSTTPEKDFTCQWKLNDLLPGTLYVAVVEARPVGSEEITAVLRGGFQTAPASDVQTPLRFCMTTCHDYLRRDAGTMGHKIYPSMSALSPDFVVHAGDVEYYDKPLPWAWTVELMRFKWDRLFSLPNNREFYATHTSYWIKDDHDTLKNDCWPGQYFGAVSFEEGVRIFNEEQFPTAHPRFQTIRWGRDLQFWILEGRDFRSPNNMPDGPEKSILGQEQKEWLKSSLQESTASFKLVFTPTPIVGPDRGAKHDNHANEDFTHEGKELREMFSQIDGLLVLCGDRHWQYASHDSIQNLWEFGCGPGSENHELGWKPNDIRAEHRFLRVQGGFLSGVLSYEELDGRPILTLNHHDVYGKQVSNFRFPASRIPAKDSVTIQLPD